MRQAYTDLASGVRGDDEVDVFRAAVAAAVTAILRGSSTDAVRAASDALRQHGLNVDPAVIRRAVEAELRARAVEVGGWVADTMWEGVQVALGEGRLVHEGPRALAKRIEAEFGRNRVDALRIARTELNWSFNKSALKGMKAAGIKEREFSAFPDADDECAEHDGEVYPVGSEEAVPPLHPNCRCALLPVV